MKHVVRTLLHNEVNALYSIIENNASEFFAVLTTVLLHLGSGGDISGDGVVQIRSAYPIFAIMYLVVSE